MDSHKKHTKHAKIPRRSLGMYASSEIAFIGAKCGDIQNLTKQIISNLSDAFQIGYIDADHASFDNPEKGDYLEEGAHVFLSDKNETVTLNSLNTSNQFDQHIQFNECDLVLVNGNHFEAQHQILFLDSSKAKSIEKRVNRLTNVLAIVEVDTTIIPSPVEDVIPNQHNISRFQYKDTQAIKQFIASWMAERKPVLNALILAGGKSTRMGENKATMWYQDTIQIERLTTILQSKVESVFVSCRQDQDIKTDLPKLYDRVQGAGPLGAITNTFRSFPNQAWLVVACDLPLLDSEVLDQLISSRSVKHTATAFLNEETGFAEPLITIWEPKSYLRMLQFEALGFTCPRKVLINSNTHLIKPKDSAKLMNVNTPEEYQKASKLLG